MPQISVVMSVYNGEKYLKDAVDSILNQTFADFEFIIIDDASTDSSLNIIKSYQDKRIIVIANKENLGLTKSLNLGFRKATGKYIARMDVDDISIPQRFAIQFDFMEDNPEIGVCGSFVKTFDDKSETWLLPTSHNEIFAGIFFQNTIIHPTVFIRSQTIFTLNEFYDETFKRSQDMEYWVRLAFRGVKLANVDKFLLKYRYHADNIGVVYKKEQLDFANQAKLKYFNKLKINNVEKWLLVHNNLVVRNKKLLKKDLEEILNWLDYIVKANESEAVFDDNALKQEIAKRFFILCHSSVNNWILLMSYQKELPNYTKAGLKMKLELFWKQFKRVLKFG